MKLGFATADAIPRKETTANADARARYSTLSVVQLADKMTLHNDEITVSEVAQLRADLVDAELSDKRINNILAVLSKPLKYAADCEVISRAPRIGMFKVERPEIEPWDFAQYARLLAAAKAEGEDWYAAVCLAGEAGLRVGEVKALRWREDVDMIARTITVKQQTCIGVTTTPKGRTRRTVPMTATLHEALVRMATIREGFVARNHDGSQKSDGPRAHRRDDAVSARRRPTLVRCPQASGRGRWHH